MEQGRVVYRSLDFGDLNTIDIPSADFVTIRDRLNAGKTWGHPYKTELDERPSTNNTLDADRIRLDMPTYCDGQFVQYIKSGGPCNFELPFETVEIKSNYVMTENAKEKVRKKFDEELAADRVALRNDSFEVYRETKQGAIPKARTDRKAKENGDPYNCRTISDFSARGRDGLSINEETGEFRSLDLPQGERVHSNIWEVHDWCVREGLDPKGIKGVKIDIKSAFRTLCTHPADWWALCFRAGENRAFHKRWPFGLKTSVYNFLRLPLLIITYLVTKTKFKEWGARAAMYFDDLIIVAHESVIERAVQEALALFKRWKIPRQEQKFLEDNPNGAKGSSTLTILGLWYDFTNLTVGIPKPRVAEIVDEMKSFMTQGFKRSLRDWESTTGVINWTTTAIPQIRMFLTKTWSMIRAMTDDHMRRTKRGSVKRRKNCMKAGTKIKMLDDIRHDWNEIIYQFENWNGRQALLRDKWEDVPKEGFNLAKGTIAPASDASGSIGWGAVCMKGYAYGVWKESEKDLKIHIKEGLGLFALIALFGKSLCHRKINLTLRCDNNSVTSALKKGRAKDVDLAVIIRLIVKAMVEAGTMLKFWKTKNKNRTRVEYISSKNNRLADALSRGDLEDFKTITNQIPNFKQERCYLKKSDERNWQNAVVEITTNTGTQ